MNRKHNPTVALIAMALLTAILVLICTGCSAKAAAACTKDTNRQRFTVEYYHASGCRVITDNETGAQYLAVSGGGVTALQPGEE